MSRLFLIGIGYLALAGALLLNLVSAPRYGTILLSCVALCALAIVALFISAFRAGPYERKSFVAIGVCIGVVIALDAIFRLTMGIRLFDFLR